MTTSTTPTRPISGYRWRIVDIVVASVIGVAAAILFFAWNNLYLPITEPLGLVLPGSQALLYGVWLSAGVIGALVIRKPGAALFTELVAAVVSALLGAQWGGFITIEAGVVQGLGAEIVFALLLYKNWSAVSAMLAGAASGLAMGVNDLLLGWPGVDVGFKIAYVVCGTISGVVIAGLGSWFLARAIAKTGVLSRFAIGREFAVRV